MASKPQKERVRSAAFISKTGEDSKSPSVDTIELQTRFANGVKHVAKLSELPGAIVTSLAWFGLNNKFGDAMARNGGISVDDAIETVDSVYDSLKRGVWREATERGPNIALIIAAIFRAKNEKPTPEREKVLSDKLQDDAFRKGAMENFAVAAAHATILAERQAERAKSARDAAKGKTADLSAF